MTLSLMDERLRELAGWAARQNTTIGDDLAAPARVALEIRAVLRTGDTSSDALDEIEAIIGGRST